MIAPWINTCLLLTVLAWLWLIEARLRLAKAYRAKTLINEIDEMSRRTGFSRVDVVIEAVVENLAVKQKVLEEMESRIGERTVFASNTSTLPISDIAAQARRPERVVGMHFFNPVAVLPLVELVRTPNTDDTTLANAWAVTKKLRKSSVLVRDSTAFVVNRLLGRQGSVVTQALDHGNTVEETDEAVLRMGLPMAPSVLLQLVGPKVANHVRHTLHDAWPDRFPLSATLDR